MHSFDFLASIYDILARIVFQNRLIQSTNHLLEKIDENKRVLIIGGGTGKLLEYTPQGLKIYFVEKSYKMLSKAKVRKSKSDVVFYHQDFIDFQSPFTFDYIICPYFLDCFKELELKKIVSKIKTHLILGGSLLVSDFDPRYTTYFNRLVMKLMHFFFTATRTIAVTRYNNLFELLQNEGFLEVERKSWQQNFIVAVKYKLISPA